MGVFTYSDEYTSPVPPARLFKALILDSNNLIPKLMPQIVKSIEFVQGDGGVGSIKQINFQEGMSPIEVQFLPGQDGGSINKMKSTYNTKGDIVLGEEQVKAGKEKALGMYKVVEGYLLQNPDAYA
ncbi:Major pollen allergen Car b 1 isoform, putative [Ricinus communis]|uniref:Major pollen allergen Car b 1 isoform, putative n=1 Tax=Ricinus communis TaxID=3988 RepID=B9RTB9_RICCO|nr:Major pollen allergen Car b 1 isoform, putative [Ricinus communis]